MIGRTTAGNLLIRLRRYRPQRPLALFLRSSSASSNAFAPCRSSGGTHGKIYFDEFIPIQHRCISSSAAAAPIYDSQTFVLSRRDGVRNVAIVAHVDHGKTTLVDELLKVASATSCPSDGDSADGPTITTDDSSSDLDRLMDSGELEQERGITITSKVTRLDYGQSIVNVVDTPGHADFAGEVDRILSMVDGVVLVVDAAEGPKSQTKYVLSRALSLGLKPIAVLNKADRSDAASRIESGQTESDLLDLFDALGADDEQMEYRTLYASARSGWVTDDADVALSIAESGKLPEDTNLNMTGLLDAILSDIPPPSVHCYFDDSDSEEAIKSFEAFDKDPFALAATTVGYDQYLGRTVTGRIYSGKVTNGDSIAVLHRDGGDDDKGASGPTSSITGVFANRGVVRMPLDPSEASAGDIVTLTGVPDHVAVGDTLTSSNNPVSVPVDTPPLAPPTLSCLFGANNGPLAGQEGSMVTSSSIRSRLISETDNNVTITVTKSETDSEKTVVYGRGELQLGILVEQMRREGYEQIISPPRIIAKICPNTGNEIEPFEELVVDVDAEFSGTVVNALTGARKGILVQMTDDSDGKTRLVFEIPSRGLLGFGPEIATLTRGTAVMHHCFIEDRNHAGNIGVGSQKGKLVSNELGKATLYALEPLSARATHLFVAPGDMVYPGMVVGENNKTGDMEVNPVKAKATNNMRTQNKEEKLYLPPPKRMSVEELIGYMADDEVIEVTPKSVRLRKEELDSGKRERAARSRKKQQKALQNNTAKNRRK